MKRFITIILLLCSCSTFAVDRNADNFADPAQETRYKALLEELRCVLCQNQSLADSNAEIAQSLRNQVREMLDEGKTDQEIIDFLVSRYGDFVLYRPPWQTNTYILWLAPGLLLLIGLGILVTFARRKPSEKPADDPLDNVEQDRLKQLLHTDTADNNT